MKISELVAKLSALELELGDIPVFINMPINVSGWETLDEAEFQVREEGGQRFLGII